MPVRALVLALLALSVSGAAHALALSALPCGLPGMPCALPDPSFETGAEGMPIGWNLYISGPCDGQGVAPSGAAARTGAWGMRVVDRGTDHCTGFTSDPIAIVGGLQYNASVLIRAAQGAPLVRIFVAWYANDGSQLESYIYKDGYQRAPGTEWMPLWSNTTAPAYALSARIWIYAPMPGVGSFDVDDAAFVSALPAPLA